MTAAPTPPTPPTSPATPAPQPTERAQLLARLRQPHEYDLCIVGGGATGLGLALEASTRGLSVVLLESHDFAQGTSSRATKLVHGGVRYLAQGQLALVREALHERTHLLTNAPHLARPLEFLLPTYRWWERWFYGAGLKLYDTLAGSALAAGGLSASQFLSASQTTQQAPNLRHQGLRGAWCYADGQFDDARLALALARSAAAHGALLLNYCAVTALQHQAGRVTGVMVQERETGATVAVRARCVVNACGVWVDALREQDGQALGRPVQAMVAPSQGVHLVVSRAFWPSEQALLVPKTADGRVLFVLPWLGQTILGTTDTPRHDLPREPRPFAEEVTFILREAANYLQRAPSRADVRSAWVGLRPLVKPLGESGEHTEGLSREHTVLVSHSGLVSVTGGKWTTYRAMAEDVLERCARAQLLTTLAPSSSSALALIGAQRGGPSIGAAPGLHRYGSEAAFVASLPGAEEELAPGLSAAMVRFAARYEYARTVEDVLARRTRYLFLDAQQAAGLAAPVARLLQQETGLDPQQQAFEALAQQYATLPDAA